jgi:hypothetical protein
LNEAVAGGLLAHSALECGIRDAAFKSADAVSALQSGFAAACFSYPGDDITAF